MRVGLRCLRRAGFMDVNLPALLVMRQHKCLLQFRLSLCPGRVGIHSNQRHVWGYHFYGTNDAIHLPS